MPNGGNSPSDPDVPGVWVDAYVDRAGSVDEAPLVQCDLSAWHQAVVS